MPVLSSHLRYTLDVLANYVTFGLALYAVGAFVSLMMLRRRNGKISRPLVSSLTRAYFCIVALVLLEAIRQVWDSFHYEHFPLWITRTVLPCLYLLLGNSVFRITREGFAQPWMESTHPELGAIVPQIEA